MADVAQSVESATFEGLEATYNGSLSSSDRYQFVNNGKTLLHVKNGDTSDHTVTVETPRQVQGLAVDDVDIVVTAGEERFIGPFPPAVFNAAGLCSYTLDDATGMTVAIVTV